jgi:hypothetical protein
MKTIVIIQADYNDGDILHQIKENTSEKEIKLFRKVAKVIKEMNREHHNWGIGYCLEKDNDPRILYKGKLTKKEIEDMEDILPYGEYGIHTIYSIRILEVEKDEELLLFK